MATTPFNPDASAIREWLVEPCPATLAEILESYAQAEGHPNFAAWCEKRFDELPHLAPLITIRFRRQKMYRAAGSELLFESRELARGKGFKRGSYVMALSVYLESLTL
jgi:hypothetical protein